MREGRVKHSAKNAIMSFAYQLITIVLSFVSRTVFIHTLGMEYLGLNGIFSDVLGLLAMADLGFGTAMAYSFYKPLAENDEKKITALIQFYKKVYRLVASLVTILGLACIPFLDLIVKTEKDIPNLVIYYLFSLAGIVISYLFVYKTTLLTADQKDYKLVAVRMVMSVARTLLQIIVLLLYKNYIVYLCINLVMNLLTNIVSTRETEKNYPYIKTKEKVLDEQVEAEMKKDILGNMKSVFIYKLSTTLFTATDNILISTIIGTVMVGIYSNYLLLSSKLLLVEQIIFSAMTASIGNVIAKDKAEKKLEVFEAMQSASFIFSGIITTGFFLMANDVIHVWLGDTFALSIVTVLAIAINNYLSCVLQPLWSYRDASGMYMKTKYVMLIAAILNIVLSVILGLKIGIAGIIFASAIARLSTYFWYEPKILFKEYFNSPVKNYYASMAKHITLIALTIIVLYIPCSKFKPDSWFELIVKMIIIAMTCSIIFLVSYSKSKGFQIILLKVNPILNKIRCKRGR